MGVISISYCGSYWFVSFSFPSFKARLRRNKQICSPSMVTLDAVYLRLNRSTLALLCLSCDCSLFSFCLTKSRYSFFLVLMYRSSNFSSGKIMPVSGAGLVNYPSVYNSRFCLTASSLIMNTKVPAVCVVAGPGLSLGILQHTFSAIPGPDAPP